MIRHSYHLISGFGNPSTLSSSMAEPPTVVSCFFISVTTFGFSGSLFSWFTDPKI